MKNKPLIGTRLNFKNCVIGTFVAFKPPRTKNVVAYGEIADPGQGNKNDSLIVKIVRVKIPGYVLSDDRISSPLQQ